MIRLTNLSHITVSGTDHNKYQARTVDWGKISTIFQILAGYF